MAQQLRPPRYRVARRLAAILLLSLVALGGSVWLAIVQPNAAQRLGIMEESVCAGLCQACYCDAIVNGECYVGGQPSGCIGCVGACTSDDNCECEPGRGGCGAELAWCRDSDCDPQGDDDDDGDGDDDDGPQPTPTPVPPVCDVGRTTVHVEEPAITWEYEPEYPVAVHQDPTFRGFDILIQAKGGWAEKRRVELTQECRDGNGTYPEDCPDEAWEWVCEEQVLEHHDDPLVRIDMPMRLDDSSVAWIEGYLRQRYYGATRKEPLPWVFHLWQGEAMRVSTGLMEYKAQDPGVHGGRIIATTKGTPLNPPQVIEQPYSVPVYLLDTTIQK